MASIPGWTERLDSLAKWVGSESIPPIYCDQSTNAVGGIITRDSNGVMGVLNFKTNVVSNNSSSVGGLVFSCNSDATKYYCLTWKIDWGGGVYLYIQDTVTSSGTNVIYSVHSNVRITDGASHNIELQYNASTGEGVISIDDGVDVLNFTIPTPYPAGYVGYGGVDSWEVGNSWEFISLSSGVIPTTRRRIMIIS